MKNFRKIIAMGLMALGFAGVTTEASAQQISNHYFGENAWMPDTIGNANACTDPPCFLNGKLHKQWQNVKKSGAQIIRFGGITPDDNMPTNHQYIKMIDSIRVNGMEPVMQVPFADYRYTALQAAEIVKYVNKTKNKNVKYWIIGNEPNLGYHFTTAAQVAAYIKPFATAMKAIDPNIIIIGPEVAWYDTGILNGLTTPGGPDDITGKDANGRYYVDIISFHTYPFSGSQSRSQVISKLESTGGFDDNLKALNVRIANCNAYHNRTGAATLKTAVTEANINWQNPSGDNVYGLGANSFIGGQFIAEMLAIGLRNNVDFVNLWSVAEGNSVESSIGYINPQTNTMKPAYYHFKMMAESFKGVYAEGKTNKANVKAYGSKDGQFIQVLVMNQENTGSYDFTVRLDNSTVSGSNPLKVNIDAGTAIEYNDAIQNQATVLLTFNTAGTLVKKTEYTLNGHAASNLAPVTTEFITTGVGETAGTSVAAGEFGINLYPNPTAGKFTIDLSKGSSTAANYDVEIFNMIGQQVYKSKSEFNGGKEQVELTPSMAQGTYIVRVKEKNGKNLSTKRIVLAK